MSWPAGRKRRGRRPAQAGAEVRRDRRGRSTRMRTSPLFHQCALPPWTAELELTAPSTVSMTLALTCLNMMSTILASLLPSKHIGNRQLLSLLIAIHMHPRRPRHGAHDELHTATPSVLLLPKSSTHRPRRLLHNSHTISWKVFPPPPLFLRLGGHIDRGVRALSGFILSHQTELGQQIEN